MSAVFRNKRTKLQNLPIKTLLFQLPIKHTDEVYKHQNNVLHTVTWCDECESWKSLRCIHCECYLCYCDSHRCRHINIIDGETCNTVSCANCRYESGGSYCMECYSGYVCGDEDKHQCNCCYCGKTICVDCSKQCSTCSNISCKWYSHLVKRECNHCGQDWGSICSACSDETSVDMFFDCRKCGEQICECCVVSCKNCEQRLCSYCIHKHC